MSETKKYPYTVEPNIIKLAPNYYRILIKKVVVKINKYFLNMYQVKLEMLELLKERVLQS